MKDIQMIPTSRIEVNKGQIEGLPKNPRFIKDARFKQLKKSIEDAPEMLEMRGLIVVEHGKKFVTIAGNMRLRACKDLGYEELPCYVLPETTPVEKLREYAIKDNIAFGADDFDLLANEWDLSELTDWGFDGGDWLITDAADITPDDCGDTFTLPAGGKTGLNKMTIMLADEQAALIRQCMNEVSGADKEYFGNRNKIGNAIYCIAKEWAELRK